VHEFEDTEVDTYGIFDLDVFDRWFLGVLWVVVNNDRRIPLA